MHKRIKNVVGLLLILSCIFTFPINTNAKEMGPEPASGKNEIAAQVPADATIFAEAHYQEVIEASKPYHDRLSSVIWTDYDLGEPYVVYDPSHVNNSAIYYYPIYLNKSTVLTLSVISTTDGWTLSASDEMVDGLNQIDYYHKDSVIFYETDHKIIAQSDDFMSVIADTSDAVNEISVCMKSDFSNLSYAEKVDIILDGMEELQSVNIEQFKNNTQSIDDIPLSYSPAFKTDTSTSKVCQLYSAQGQGSDPICWAASVATIVNYRNGTSRTAKNVCDAIKHTYTGGSIDDIKSALNYYNINYQKSSSQLSWSNVTKNLKNKYPIAALTYDTKDGGHTIAVYGYQTISVSDYIIFWNPGSKSSQTVYYVANGSTYTYNNKTWTWLKSVSQYN